MGFVKGQTGNPGGRPSTKKLRKLLKELEPDALLALAADLRGPSGPERSKAVALVLAYRYGKPTEKLEHTGDGGGPLVVEIRSLAKDDDDEQRDCAVPGPDGTRCVLLEGHKDGHMWEQAP